MGRYISWSGCDIYINETNYKISVQKCFSLDIIIGFRHLESLGEKSLKVLSRTILCTLFYNVYNYATGWYL